MNNDFEPEERDTATLVKGAIEPIEAALGKCPAPDLLQAAQTGVLPQDLDQWVGSHLAACPLCKILTADLEEVLEVEMTSEERDNVRARIESRIEAQPKVGVAAVIPFRRRSHISWAAGLAAVLIMGFGWFWLTSQRPPAGTSVSEPAGPSTTPVATPRVAPPRATTPPAIAPPLLALSLQKAAIRLPASALLGMRTGMEMAEAQFLESLVLALEPYRADDFKTARERLGIVAQTRPDRAEPHFYLGVSQLFLGENEGAVVSLKNARRVADADLRASVGWYLAIAQSRAGRLKEARSELEIVCAGPGEYQQDACAAVKVLVRQR
jgi:hypothetical protein